MNTDRNANAGGSWIRRWAEHQKNIFKLKWRTAAWYVFMTLAGVLLYQLGANHALRERGYYAVGGEALALLLPLFYYAAASTIRDFAQTLWSRRRTAHRVPFGQGERPFRLDQGMPAEVMTDFDTILLFGRLVKLSPEELTVGRIAEERAFPIIEVGDVVLVCGYDARLNPILLRARVVCSTETVCTVGELKLISDQITPGNARCPLCPPAVYCAASDTDPGQLQPCRLLCLSAGGACIISERCYKPGQRLYLWVGSPENVPNVCCSCEVVSAAPRRVGRFEYELLFVSLNSEQEPAKAFGQELQSIRNRR